MKQGRIQRAPTSPWAIRYRVWRAGLGVQPAKFVVPPEPRSIGSATMGRQICDGHVLVAGQRIDLGDGSIWAAQMPDAKSDADRHGFTWLDDLAATGTNEAARLVQNWLSAWLNVYGNGTGPGWRPDLAARRLVRWTHHATGLLDGMDPGTQTQFRRAISRHVTYLARHWRDVPTGFPTFEALCGLIQGGLALEGMQSRVRPGVKALEQMCRHGIDDGGALPSRNPEELLDLFTMLVWSETAMTEVGLAALPEHRAAITRIAPTLRALRHADGGLARFHGGGRGIEGRLDSALVAARVRTPARDGAAMGFARMARGRSTIILDAAAPPAPPHAATAHASTLAFEMTTGRRPLIVNCGSGLVFGPEWASAARATSAHSTVAPDGASSAQLKPAPRGPLRGQLILSEAPRHVHQQTTPTFGPAQILASHDGFHRHFGLIHHRDLTLAADGLTLDGEDNLAALDTDDQRRFDGWLRQHNQRGIGLSLRFHLHPDVTASIAKDGVSVDLMLKSGELWLFRHHSNARISLDPSVYLEKTRPQPIPTRQIVLAASAVEYSTTIRWSLTRPQSHQPPARDLYRDDMSIT